MSHVLTVACHSCEAIGPRLGRSTAGVFLLARSRSGGVGSAWSAFLAEHELHDLRLLAEGYNPEQPIPGWMPRLVHGPPESGHMIDQHVACPICYGTTTVWKTIDRGHLRFVFCRTCGHTWGQAVQVEIARAELADRPVDLAKFHRHATRTDS